MISTYTCNPFSWQKIIPNLTYGLYICSRHTSERLIGLYYTSSLVYEFLSHIFNYQFRWASSRIFYLKMLKLDLRWTLQLAPYSIIFESWYLWHYRNSISRHGNYQLTPETTCIKLYMYQTLPHQVRTLYLHFRFHAKYFLLPWEISEEISRRSMLLYN